MSDGALHYVLAERLLAAANDDAAGHNDQTRTFAIQAAQVHATLATCDPESVRDHLESARAAEQEREAYR